MNIYCIINYFLFTMTGIMLTYIGVDCLFLLVPPKKNETNIKDSAIKKIKQVCIGNLDI